MYRDSFAFHDIINISYPEIPVIGFSNGMLICTTQNDSVNGYQWYFNGYPYGYNSLESTIPVIGEGDYSVAVWFKDNCLARSDIFHYSIMQPADIAHQGSEDFIVIPNPGNGDFDIMFPPELKDKKAMIVLRDLSGRVVEKRIVVCERTESIQAKGIAKGVYLLTVESERRSFRQRVVVQ